MMAVKCEGCGKHVGFKAAFRGFCTKDCYAENSQQFKASISAGVGIETKHFDRVEG